MRILIRINISSAGTILLPLFQREQITDTINNITYDTGRDYMVQAQSEYFKIIGDLDVLTSPLQNAQKLAKGVRDFAVYPIDRYSLCNH